MGFKFNPLGSPFDLVVEDGFLPYDTVIAGQILSIPTYRQMNLVEEITVLGELFIEGSLNIIFDAPVWSYRAITASRTLDDTDELIEVTANSITVTLPTAVSFINQYTVKNNGTGIVTINTTSGQTIDGFASGTILLVRYDSITLRSNNANWIVI